MLRFPRPEETWQLVLYAVSHEAEEHESRLQAEAEIFGLDVPAMLEFVNHSDPEAALNLYRKANPDLDVSHTKLKVMLETDPYPLAVGVLRCMQPEAAASEDPEASLDGAHQDLSNSGGRSESTDHADIFEEPPTPG
jgi:hypothetical protein